MTRPRRLVFVAGTGTEVGKTWAATLVLRVLRERGVSAAARKVAQSFDPGSGPTDADLLAAATGDEPGRVCPLPRWYERPMAPPMAADALGRPPFTIGELARELAWPPGIDVGLVEGAGGARSPIAHDGDNVDLARAVRCDLVVLVADAGLGTINAVRLCADAFGPVPIVVFLNRYDGTADLHRRNREWLVEHDGRDVLVAVDALGDRLVG